VKLSAGPYFFLDLVHLPKWTFDGKRV